MDRQAQTDADRQITDEDAHRYTKTNADRQADHRSINHRQTNIDTNIDRTLDKYRHRQISRQANTQTATDRKWYLTAAPAGAGILLIPAQELAPRFMGKVNYAMLGSVAYSHHRVLAGGLEVDTPREDVTFMRLGV